MYPSKNIFLSALSVLFALATLALSGCAADLGGDAYSRDEARKTMSVRFATIESVRAIRIEGTKTPIGAAAGTAVGAIAGSTIGHGRGSAVAAVLGGVAGGLGGAAIEEAVTRENGVEVTVKLDNGQFLAVVQTDKGENFQPGERVRLVGGDQATRVTR